MAPAWSRRRRSSSLRPVAETSGEPITKQGLEDLRAELADLEGPRRQAMAARIKVAREEGDLKENAEYHIAKEDQAHLETRIKRLRERLQNGGRDRGQARRRGRFAFGLTAEVLDEESGAVNTWTLVGSTEADLAAGRLSAESPIGRALLNAEARQAGRGRDPSRGSHLRRSEARLGAGGRRDLGRLAAALPVGLGRGRRVAQVPLGVEGAHAAGAGGGDRLAVGVVDDVADGEDAAEVGPGRAGPR